MVDNWIDCPHCAKNVIAFPNECRACGKDLRYLEDGSQNPGQTNPWLATTPFAGRHRIYWVKIIKFFEITFNILLNAKKISLQAIINASTKSPSILF